VSIYVDVHSAYNRRSFMVVTPGRDADVSSWPRGIGAITLFVEDVEAAQRFYREVFGLPVVFADDNSAVFDFGNTIINLLQDTAARELIELAARGVELLNGPMDRPWGVRTASFSDPGGHIWEIAQAR